MHKQVRLAALHVLIMRSFGVVGKGADIIVKVLLAASMTCLVFSLRLNEVPHRHILPRDELGVSKAIPWSLEYTSS